MNATKAGRPQKDRARFGASTHGRFFDKKSQLYLEMHNGAATKTASHVKSTAALKVSFAGAYAVYKAAGGAL